MLRDRLEDDHGGGVIGVFMGVFLGGGLKPPVAQGCAIPVAFRIPSRSSRRDFLCPKITEGGRR